MGEASVLTVPVFVAVKERSESGWADKVPAAFSDRTTARRISPTRGR
jgi:hypothetical protein